MSLEHLLPLVDEREQEDEVRPELNSVSRLEQDAMRGAPVDERAVLRAEILEQMLPIFGAHDARVSPADRRVVERERRFARSTQDALAPLEREHAAWVHAT